MTDPSWNAKIAQLPGAHLLQTSEWGKVKALVGWKSTFCTWDKEDRQIYAAAMILQRSLPIRGFSAVIRIMYVPKGPLLKDWDSTETRTRILQDLEEIARTSHAVFIKIDPDVPLAFGVPINSDAVNIPVGEDTVRHLISRGWILSYDQIQFRNTLVIDLTPDPETLLSQMKQKTRYNVRLASRKGVSIRFGNAQDLPLLYTMYAETSIRDGFVIRDQAYYLHAWQTFITADMLDILVAEVEGQPVAALLLYHFGQTAWYMYGMSRDIHREKMASYLLQWEAIRRAKSLGCTRYDLWGAPDHFSEDDPMWGVYKFKEGLGGKVVRNIGAWDFPVKPWLYKLYTQILPRILDLARLRGKAQTRRSIEG